MKAAVVDWGMVTKLLLAFLMGWLVATLGPEPTFNKHTPTAVPCSNVAVAPMVGSEAPIQQPPQLKEDATKATSKGDDAIVPTAPPPKQLAPGLPERDGQCQPGIPKPVPTMYDRNEFGEVLEKEGMKIGAELGVQRGLYSKIVLSKWKSVEKYHLVDLWGRQANYEDIANVAQKKQDARFNETQRRLKPFEEKLAVCRNLTIACATQFNDGYFDFVYVDARHDRKGVLQDLEAWWPKVKCGGIMAGHDYFEQRELSVKNNGDWTINYDGTRDTSGRIVRGAVDDFFMGPLSEGHRRQVTIGMNERTWYVRK